MDDFQTIYHLYFEDVYRYVFAMCKNAELAEEITQETFFKALKKIDRFEGKCTLFAWLCQIAKNTYYTQYTKNKRYSSYPVPDEKETADSFVEELTSRETAFEIHKILHHLEEPYKEVFSLRIFGELPFKQIGELFGKTESWARVTFHRAKMKIKEELK